MRPLAAVVPAAVMELLRTTPLSPGKVTFAWKTAVGAALDRATAVKLEGDVLVVETSNPQWAREILRSSGVIQTRLKALLGDSTVTRIDIRINPNLQSAN